ncbi:MAG: acyl-CoA-binding protein [Desulfobacteraceae bacterium IS3]|nr:MAG: acyl-CoA-binding protein [Desulfobacteraceae bacterium IS3]
MSDLEVKFEAAAQNVQKLSKRPDNDTLLKLYALYKQGKEGNVSGKRPGITDFKGKAKYDAWAGLKDMSKEAAMKSYIELVSSLR